MLHDVLTPEAVYESVEVCPGRIRFGVAVILTAVPVQDAVPAATTGQLPFVYPAFDTVMP